MSYKNLEIWVLARTIVIKIHKMTLDDLPKFEMYQVGSQIRRSSKSIKANIVEGYGRRMYKNDFIKFLTYSISSNDETTDHLGTLFDTGSLKDAELFNDIHNDLILLGKKLNNFIKSVNKNHKSQK